jgi:hypothetical protein
MLPLPKYNFQQQQQNGSKTTAAVSFKVGLMQIMTENA